MKMKRLASGGLVLALVVPGVANAEQMISNLIGHVVTREMFGCARAPQDGLITAHLGKVGTGERLTVDFNGDGLIKFAVDGKILQQVTGPNGTPLIIEVSKKDQIKADEGQVVLTAKAYDDLLSSVVNKTGFVETKRLVKRGEVILLAGDPPGPTTGAIGWQANLDQRRGAAGAALPTEQITREKTQELAFQYAARDLPELKASQ